MTTYWVTACSEPDGSFVPNTGAASGLPFYTSTAFAPMPNCLPDSNGNVFGNIVLVGVQPTGQVISNTGVVTTLPTIGTTDTAFDYTFATEIWAFALTTVVMLYLVGLGAGSVLQFIKRS